MGINIGARLLVFRWYSPVTKKKLADPRVMHTSVSSYLEGICIPFKALCVLSGPYTPRGGARPRRPPLHGGQAAGHVLRA